MAKRSKLAVLSFVFSVSPFVISIVLGLVFPLISKMVASTNLSYEPGIFIFSLMAIGLVLFLTGFITSLISLYIIKKENLAGKELAITALIISSIPIIIYLLLLLGMFILG